jgi:hypothetical protein
LTIPPTAALDELYIHHALRQVEADVRYEEGEQGPDFRVYHRGRQVLAVEVLSLFLRPEWARQARRHHELTDRLNRTFRPGATSSTSRSCSRTGAATCR